MNKVTLTNSEYHELYLKGGDNLISVFAMLRFHKKGKTYITPKGKDKPLKTLEKMSGVSRNTLYKYTPILIDMGLVFIQKNGNIQIRSTYWSNKNLPKRKTLKLIPIVIEENYVKTKVNSAFVRIVTSLKNQIQQSEKKSKQQELLSHKPKTIKEFKRQRSLKKRLGKDGISVRHYTTISNQLFANLIAGKGKTKQSGKYHKKKLLKLGLINQVRKVHLAFPNNHNQKFLRAFKESLQSGGCFMGKDGIYFEDSPFISLNDLVGKIKS